MGVGARGGAGEQQLAALIAHICSERGTGKGVLLVPFSVQYRRDPQIDGGEGAGSTYYYEPATLWRS